MPVAGPSIGSQSDTIPGNIGPRTIAWRISRPSAATSDDVMPPLAITNLARRRPRFVIAKGGITSSDVAALGLEIRHAMVRGPMLPGIVSLWEPMEGPATGIPYVVFAGNVGDEDSLCSVVRTLSAFTAEN